MTADDKLLRGGRTGSETHTSCLPAASMASKLYQARFSVFYGRKARDSAEKHDNLSLSDCHLTGDMKHICLAQNP